MHEAVIEWQPTRAYESLTALDQRTSDPTPDVGWPQVDPKELRTPRRHTNVAKSNDLISIKRHIKAYLSGLDEGNQFTQALRGVVGADKLVDDGWVKEGCVGELPCLARDGKHRFRVTAL
jgi:hypothetical protein